MIKNRIKEYRARYDMKQEDLAKLVGVRRETIGNLEKGRYNPSLVLAWNIAKVFNVTIEEIFTITEDQFESENMIALKKRDMKKILKAGAKGKWCPCFGTKGKYTGYH